MELLSRVDITDDDHPERTNITAAHVSIYAGHVTQAVFETFRPLIAPPTDQHHGSLRLNH